MLLLAVGFDIFNKNRSGGESILGKQFKRKTTPPPVPEKTTPAQSETVGANTK